MADDAPIVVALLAGGAERDRWRDWLSAAGVRVDLCERLAAVASLVPRPSLVVVDAKSAESADRHDAIARVDLPILVIGDENVRPVGLEPAARLPSTATRPALVGTVLALSAGLRVTVGQGRPAHSADASGSSASPGNAAARTDPNDEDDVTAEDWWSESPTPREREVIALAALGLTNGAIAARLGLSAHTVKFHLASIYAKLGARGRTQAVRRAIRRGWIAV